jgi:cytochrome bd-type quinol oxidase subunit 1
LCRCVAYQVQQLRRQKIPIFCRCGRRFVWSWYVCSMLYNCILKAFCVASGRVRWRVVDNCKGTFYLVVVCFVSRVWSFIQYYILYIVVCVVVVAWCVLSLMKQPERKIKTGAASRTRTRTNRKQINK